MLLEQTTLEHGETFGKLRVIERVKTPAGRTRYRVGCECGYSGMLVRMSHLLLKCSESASL